MASIEITVPLIVNATMSFYVEEGELLTRAMIDEYLNDLQAFIDNTGGLKTGGADLYAQILDFDRNLPIDAYDSSTGMDWSAEIGAPVPKPEGLQVRHDVNGWYVCSDDEARHEDEGDNSSGFDGRVHFASLEEAWADAAGNQIA